MCTHRLTLEEYRNRHFFARRYEASTPFLVDSRISNSGGWRNVTLFPDGLYSKYDTQGRLAPQGTHRSEIYGLSRASRARLSKLLIRLELKGYSLYWGTLTYPQTWPQNQADWHADFKYWRNNLAFRHGDNLVGGLWLLEFQERGAPHIHYLLIMQKPIRYADEQTYWREKWSERTAAYRTEGQWTRTQIIPLRRQGKRAMGKLYGYIRKYARKASQKRLVDAQTGELLPTGRMWGTIKLIPLSAGSTWRMNQAEWECFLDRAKATFDHSRYVQSLDTQAVTVLIFGPPEDFEPLLRFLGCKVPT